MGIKSSIIVLVCKLCMVASIRFHDDLIDSVHTLICKNQIESSLRHVLTHLVPWSLFPLVWRIGMFSYVVSMLLLNDLC